MNTLSGVTSKLIIGGHDLYLKTAWRDGEIVHIDITLSRGGDSGSVSAGEVALEQSKHDLARSWVEDSCRMASRLLDKGVTIEEVTGMWMGVEGFPSGYSPQIGGLVRGPLHAVAMVIRQRHDDWKAMVTR